MIPGDKPQRLSGRELEYRALQDSDVSSMLAIEQAAHSYPCSESILRSFLTRKHAHILGVFDHSKLLGFCIISVVADESELINMAVHPDYQGCGYGRLLLEQAIAQLPAATQGMFLEVRESNRRAIGLYEHMGFLETGVRHNYYPSAQGREDAILMARDFSDHNS